MGAYIKIIIELTLVMNETSIVYGYFNGAIIPVTEMQISPLDLGVLRGYGVFDVMRTEHGKPFLLDRHWARFENSAKMLGLTIPVSKQEYESILQELLEKNGYAQANIRTVLTGGPSEDSFLPDGKETFFILITPFHGLDASCYTEGVKLMTLDFNRQLPEAKITQYVSAIKFAQKRKNENALEILYVQNGKVLEASTSNFCIIKDGVLITPRENILLGITREVTLSLAKELGMKVEEREVSLEEVLQADEAFITATNKYIVPVVAIDNHQIYDGKIGSYTQRLIQSMKEFIKNS